MRRAARRFADGFRENARRRGGAWLVRWQRCICGRLFNTLLKRTEGKRKAKLLLPARAVLRVAPQAQDDAMLTAGGGSWRALRHSFLRATSASRCLLLGLLIMGRRTPSGTLLLFLQLYLLA